MVIYQHYKTRKIMKKLTQMLDSAIEGKFSEQLYNESLISSFESRFYRYLSANEASAQNLAKEKEQIKQLLADISHQTKTPLANILLYAQLLEEHDLKAESLNAVSALRGQAGKLSFLIDTLVKLSRLETGVFKLHPTLSPVSTMIEDVIFQFEQKALHKEIKLGLVDVKGIHALKDVYAYFDYKWTAEALGNLLDNAIKYTPIGGEISISVIEYDLFCRIDIKDNGIGISEDEQAKIFARFYRSPSVYHQEGIGIGLYLTRHIISEQNGYIKVSSTLDKGTVFSIFLPRKA
ncbi:HAMP domain-containing sensor histidine kinase [Fusibacter bizertensis]|uniref:histidine kinase n=1 Tax=Fusibacter bizertensis TaxID=1488331 RepID=A0ABT6NCF3_9FIRM|nr:HAMP domain-containing sensor histidine kinase [Fusibacter bizertensis]MDH8678056.1 HAMP domain-containing sensor histidine kinase [Fusibacter bizertensis]